LVVFPAWEDSRVDFSEAEALKISPIIALFDGPARFGNLPGKNGALNGFAGGASENGSR
jgi:hypothetical protein